PYLYHEPNEHFGRTITEANSLAHYNKHITITEANSLVHYNKHITTTEANSLAHYNKRITTTEANSLAHYNKRITITEANSLAHDNKRITTTEANSLAHYNKRITITSLRFRLPPVSFFLVSWPSTLSVRVPRPSPSAPTAKTFCNNKVKQKLFLLSTCHF
ncbi:hypothetical protein BgiMline_021491, partial [Biomphalaria glabrata]